MGTRFGGQRTLGRQLRDGLINVYDPTTGAFIETLTHADGTPLQLDRLWDLLPLGTGVYFSAGIADESHGLFGLVTEDQ